MLVDQPDWHVVRLSQEHGIIGRPASKSTANDATALETFHVGQTVQIYCQHTCITASRGGSPAATASSTLRHHDDNTNASAGCTAAFAGSHRVSNLQSSEKKCDEGKPNCRRCIRNELGCQWPAEQSHKPARHAARICSTSPNTENGPSSSQGIPRGEVTEALVSEISPPRLQCAPRQASSDVTDTLLEQFGQAPWRIHSSSPCRRPFGQDL